MRIGKRVLPPAVVLVACAIALLGAAPAPRVHEPDTLVILSTNDVLGKNEPCGCHIPKGGLSRRATFHDSLSAQYGQVLLVDAGGFFPDEADSFYREKATFLMDAMTSLGTDAAGVSEKELKYGRGFLLANQRTSKLPLVSANLMNRTSRKPLVAPSRVIQKGTVKVGVFGLTSDKIDLGPSRDSLLAEDPVEAATRTVAELKKKGATVIVLLSMLGKVESEDVVASVDGIDVVITGRNVPVLQKGRMIKNTIANYGGEQGHHIGRTLVQLDAQRRMKTATNDVFVLGPEVNDKPEVLAMVKQFNDGFNDRMRAIEKARAAAASVATGGERTSNGDKPSPDHFVGAEVCARCHAPEYQQWQTTAHARAWQTLVDVNREATPECVTCHVVGYQQPGGFKASEDAGKLGNVQCENCHGMGTQHEALAA
ncbi:MAG: hypothetical protein K8R56_02365, partial [Candidatus Eisenbacteria bacterium]|nr:hypothetical protein [Candidatus Eisenbacteria bacterium]